MGLVNYSDSETSDAENQTASLDPPEDDQVERTRRIRDDRSSKTAIGRSETRKIQINLSKLSGENGSHSYAEAERALSPRPAKRVRAAFNSFNSFLPAPQNAIKSSKATQEERVEASSSKHPATGLRSGINLKTGTAPAFSRTLPEEDAFDHLRESPEPSFAQGQKNIFHSDEKTTSLLETAETFKPLGRSTMFKPLSVAKKQKRKKSNSASKPESSNPILETANPNYRQNMTSKQDRGLQLARKPLFPTYDETILEQEGKKSDSHNLLLDPTKEHAGQSYQEQTTTVKRKAARSQESPYLSEQRTDLESVAESLGLSTAQKRQLFGREGKAGNTTVTNFSIAAEYSHNNKLMESQSAVPAHNPVRGIAPGKHSLQQLVNAATSQKEALEESFASGKRNRKDAGSRYGW